MVKVLLFDFDGTIADSFENFLEIVNIIFKKHDVPLIPRSEIEKIRSEDIQSLVKSLQIPLIKLPFIAHDIKTTQEEQISVIEPFDEIPKVLHKLKSLGYLLGILTSNGEENVKFFIQKYNIDIFDYIYAEAGIFRKDKTIQKFLNDNSFSSEQVVYIGDEIRDIEACKKIGLKIISVTWGFNSKEGLVKYHPDFLIDKPNDLLNLHI